MYVYMYVLKNCDVIALKNMSISINVNGYGTSAGIFRRSGMHGGAAVMVKEGLIRIA